MTQKEFVYQKFQERKILTTNALRYMSEVYRIADAHRHARTLFREGLLTRRKITEAEMSQHGYKTKVKVYELREAV